MIAFMDNNDKNQLERSIDELKGDLVNQENALNSETKRAIKRENEIEELFTMPTQEAVNKWLDEHPESTTTVQDGSITEEKIYKSFLYMIGYPIFDTFPTEDTISLLGENAVFYTRGFYKKMTVAILAILFIKIHMVTVLKSMTIFM